MNRDQLSREMQEQIRKSLLSYSIFRPESAVVIALTLILVTLAVLGLPWFPGTWWMWLAFGLLGEGLIVLSSLRDPKFYQQVMDQVFHEKFDVRRIRNPDLRQKVAKALDYREQISREIDRKRDEVLDAYLRDTAHGLEDWIAQVYRLALSLDDDKDPMITREMQSVQQEITRYRADLVRQKGTAVQADIEKTLSIKQSQLDALSSLRDTREKARLQLEDTLSAISTVYTQIVLLGSKDVNSARAQRLQQDMVDQVHALRDTSDAMDEVYQSSGVKPTSTQTASRAR
jgi:hypothetical protein